jgi:hypothetical protein
MRVRVVVRDKQLDVQLGDGSQSMLWLANAALCRYDSSMGLELGPPLGLRLEDGTQLPLQCAVADYLQDGAHVFVVLAREQEQEQMQQQQQQQEDEEDEGEEAPPEGADDAPDED